jgi:NAD(P)H dehydrogenase (quinone)
MKPTAPEAAMTPRSILLLVAHPDPRTFGGALAQAYAEGATVADCDVDVVYLSALEFDAAPAGRPGPLEPALVDARERILRCSHLVLVYPTWLGAMPARMKGFFERVFGDGFAMRVRPGSIVPEGLLKGRSADVLVTMDTPPLLYRLLLGAPGHALVRRAILGPAGIRPVRVQAFGPMRQSSDARRAGWLAQVRSRAIRTCSRLAREPAPVAARDPA